MIIRGIKPLLKRSAVVIQEEIKRSQRGTFLPRGEPLLIGIYIIVGPKNRVYVGSTKYVFARWRRHTTNLRNKRHKNKRLQAAWEKYGASRFEFWFIEECAVAQLEEREQFWLDKLEAVKTGYNIAQFVDRRPSPKGKRMPLRVRRKISERLRAHANSAKGRKRLSRVSKANWAREEHQAFMAEVRRKYWANPLNRQKRSEQAKAQHREGRFGR